jgi:simple sugar transport system ATP-binding protein
LTLRTSELERAVAERAAELNMPIDPKAQVMDLPVDIQQKVEIVKAMYRGGTILIMDEPTSLLGPSQIENLLSMLSDLRASGHSIILVTHKLAEVMEVADRVTVLRRGKRVACMERGDFDERTLARAMTGQDRERLPDRASTGHDRAVAALEIADLVVHSHTGHGEALDGLSLVVSPGEIVGIAGVEGNGQRELVDAIIGVGSVSGGTIRIGGVDVTHLDARARREMGLGAIPEDRQGLGLVLDMSLAENLALSALASGEFRRRGMIRWGEVRSRAVALLEEYDVRPPDPGALAGSLSGGNQQKVVLAREMSRDPSVLVADNPTWGLDVGAIDYVHRRLLEMRARGGAVLLVSLDLEELFKLSDRVVVLYRGRKMIEDQAGSIDDDELAMAMAGRVASGGDADPQEG